MSLTAPAGFDARRYAGFLRLAGFKSVPKQVRAAAGPQRSSSDGHATQSHHAALPRAQVPLSYPFVESFRLCMLAVAHKDFPFPVLGAVLARNTSKMARPIAADEALTYR